MTPGDAMEGQVYLDALKAVYDFYDGFVSDFPVACHSGCHACCTVNVTVTTLEARYISMNCTVDRAALDKAALSPHYIPSITANRMAMLCLNQKEPPPERSEHVDGTCPLVDSEGLCTIYPFRPFSCRAMSSATECSESGAADMHPFVFTVNLAFYQIIEHIDAGGVTGNLIDVLACVDNDDFDRYKHRFVTNTPLPAFMTPPDEQFRFNSLFRRLTRSLLPDGRQLGELLPDGLV